MRILSALALLIPSLALAQVPQRLAYQGRLTKADGTPETGVLPVTFSLFAAAEGGAANWSETQSLALTNGYYATNLGEITPLGKVFDGRELFLEVSVGGTALAPRQRIASVPYALVAASVNGGPPSALRAAYDFEEGSGTASADSSGLGSNLSLNSSGVSWTTAGHTGNALNFDGASGYASTPGQSALNPRQEITVSAWVYQTAGATATACVVNKPGQYTLAVVNGHVQFSVQTVKDSAAAEFRGSGALPATASPAWTNVMASYDGQTIRTFVNGFLTDHADYPNGLIAESTSPLHIGDCVDANAGETNFFTGKIDEVRVWSSAKTAGEFRNIARWQGYLNDGTDNGVLPKRSVSYAKKAPGTGLRVLWSDNFRVLTNGSSCRWEVLFNGVPCANPGGIFFDKYEGGTASSRHDPATVMGTCYGVAMGSVSVTTRVMSPSPGTGHPVGDCYTGWRAQLASIEVEEVP